jgi:hypothetical protein
MFQHLIQKQIKLKNSRRILPGERSENPAYRRPPKPGFEIKEKIHLIHLEHRRLNGRRISTT